MGHELEPEGRGGQLSRPAEQAALLDRVSLALAAAHLAAARSRWTVVRARLLRVDNHHQLARLHQLAAASASPALGPHWRRRAQHHRDVAHAMQAAVERAIADLAAPAGASGRVAGAIERPVTGAAAPDGDERTPPPEP